MDITDVIDPMLIYGPGRCDKCGGQLTVVDMETGFFPLSPSGKIVGEETMVNCEAVCMNCSERYPMRRYGSEYIRDNDYTRFVELYNNLKKKEYIESKMEESKPSSDNPFCINKEREA